MALILLFSYFLVLDMFCIEPTLSDHVGQCEYLDFASIGLKRQEPQCFSWTPYLKCSAETSTECTCGTRLEAKGVDFLIFAERPFSWSEKTKERMLSAIKRLHIGSAGGAAYGSTNNRFAILQYSCKTPGAKPALLSHWSTHLDVREVNRTLRASKAKLKPSGQDLQQTLVLGAVKLLQQLSTRWLPHGTVSAEHSLELKLDPERELHVFVFSGVQKSSKRRTDSKNVDSLDTEEFAKKVKQSIVQILGSFKRDWNISISLIVSDRYRQFSDTFGSPWSDVSYRDGSHFNKALTLQKLISKGVDYQDTLQAHLLAKGVHFRVLEYDQLNYGFTSPLDEPSSGTEFVHYSFGNRCTGGGQVQFVPRHHDGCLPDDGSGCGGCDDRGETGSGGAGCDDGGGRNGCKGAKEEEENKVSTEDEGEEEAVVDGCEFCSPLHGCVPGDLQRGISLVDPTPQDHAPDPSVRITLAGFTGSHADQAPADNVERPHRDSGKADERNDSHRLSISEMCVHTSESCRWIPLQAVVKETVPTWAWEPDKPFFEDLMRVRKPVILKNSVVTKWSGLTKWSWAYLQKAFSKDPLPNVKYTNSFLSFDPDSKPPLKLKIELPYSIKNMTAADFFNCVQRPHSCHDNHLGHYFFASLPEELAQDTLPNNFLFHTTKDFEAKKQFIWISSPGMITHTHFDQDFNIFVQLKGRKRFTLWHPSQHELMYVYPRVHPMWHKSRINFQQPDLKLFPLFGKSHASQVTVYPGDVLFVPPYTWHYVETLDEPAISLSTWSHDYELYDHLHTIYRHDHKFDLIESAEGQMYALRLYLDMMIHDLYGFNQTGEYFARLLSSRYRGLEHLFHPHPLDQMLCSRRREGKIPTAIHVHGYVKLDMRLMSEHFKQLTPEVMDILFMDYVEEISAQVVGVEKLLAFFRYCFLGQEYYVTEQGTQEHSLWDHKSLNDDDDGDDL